MNDNYPDSNYYWKYNDDGSVGGYLNGGPADQVETVSSDLSHLTLNQ